MATEAEFFEKHKGWFPDGVYPDHHEVDLMALFVVDEIPNETINCVLNESSRLCDTTRLLWVADTWDTLPDFDGSAPEAPDDPVSPDWRSPFIGWSIPDVIAFLQQAPKPPKPISKQFCAVLRKEELFQDGRVLICKSLAGGDDIPEYFLEKDHVSDVEVSSEEDEGEIADQEREEETGMEKLERLARLAEKEDREPEPRSLMEIYLELGNDYEDIQIIPTSWREVGLFQGALMRRDWQERYIDWHEEGRPL